VLTGRCKKLPKWTIFAVLCGLQFQPSLIGIIEWSQLWKKVKVSFIWRCNFSGVDMLIQDLIRLSARWWIGLISTKPIENQVIESLNGTSSLNELFWSELINYLTN
jgi:hypothetical protein